MSSQSGVMEDLCDGEGFHEHPLFPASTLNSLQVLFYYDDVEVCNPLQSSRLKHKLGMLLVACGIHSVHVLYSQYYNNIICQYYF